MALRTNIGPADRLVRGVAGASLAAFAAAGLFPAGWGLPLACVGAAVALTALIGYCPLYRLLGLEWRAPARHEDAGKG